MLFLVGLPRTGSKIYMNIFNNNSGYNILNEIHYLLPFYHKKDFVRTINNLDLNSNDGIFKLVKMMYSQKFNGTFWESNMNKWTKNNSIYAIEPAELYSEIKKAPKSHKSILKSLIRIHTATLNKDIGGAKFPVDISYFPKLFSWFPDSFFLHLIRDPRAIYYSKVKAEIGRMKDENPLSRYIVMLKRLLQIVYQYKIAYRIHNSYKGHYNYKHMRFEDVITSPKEKVQELCQFAGVKFTDSMLTPPVVNSSYEIDKKVGFNVKAIDNWRSYNSPVFTNLICDFLKEEMSFFGYHSE